MSKQDYINAIKKKRPYTAKYIEKYGEKSLASTFEIPPKYKTPEELYRKCIKEGVRWQELVKIPQNVIL